MRGGTWRIVAPADRRTIRCWMGPRVHGDPEFDARLPRGRWADITDHFEAGKARWVELGEDCWVPFSSLEPNVDPLFESYTELGRAVAEAIERD